MKGLINQVTGSNMEINEYTAKRFEQIQTERGTLGAIVWLLNYMLLNN